MRRWPAIIGTSGRARTSLQRYRNNGSEGEKFPAGPRELGREKEDRFLIGNVSGSRGQL